MSSVSFLPTIVDNPVTGQVLTYDGTANPPHWYNGLAGGSGASVAAPFITHAAGGGLTNARILSNGDGTTAVFGLNPGDPAQIDWDAHSTDFITTSSITGVPNARVLTAGTGITLDTTAPNVIEIASTGNTTATYVTTGAEAPSPLPNSSQLVNGDGTTVSAPAANQVTFDWDAFSNDFLFASGSSPFPGLNTLPSPVGRLLTAGANITLTPTPGVLTISATGSGAVANWVEAAGTFSGKNWSSWTPTAAAPANAIILPKGDGAFCLQVPDGTIANGAQRGTRAVDLQRNRTSGNNRVASGQDSSLLGGLNCTASGARSIGGGGQSNQALGTNSVAFGGNNNDAHSTQAVVIGGGDNDAGSGGTATAAVIIGTQTGNISGTGVNSAIIAGNAITISGAATNSMVGGGTNNTITGTLTSAFIGAGRRNQATADGATVLGGVRTDVALTNNQATASSSSVVGGRINLASGAQSSVIGGTNNQATGTSSIVLGGERGDGVEISLNNQATGISSIVACGYQNLASGAQSGTFAGFQNTASGITSTVIGGITQTVSGNYSIAAANQGTIAVTNNNSVVMGNTGIINFNDPGILALCNATPTVSAANAIVIGSDTGTVSGARAILIGGTQAVGVAQSTGADSVAIGGKRPRATGNNSVAIGGESCSAAGLDSVVIGGNTCVANDGYSVSVGGNGCTAAGVEAGVFAGSGNQTSNSRAVVIGGQNGVASGTSSSVVGGVDNTASGLNSGTFAGQDNSATGNYCGVVAGSDNTSGGDNGGILGGTSNTTSGTASGIVCAFTSSNAADRTVICGGTTITIDAASINSGSLGGASNSITGGTRCVAVGGTSSTVQGTDNGVIAGSVNSIPRGVGNVIIGGTSNTINPGVLDNATGAVVLGSDSTTSATDYSFCFGATGGGLGSGTANCGILGGIGLTVTSARSIALGGTYNETGVIGGSQRQIMIGNGASAGTRSNCFSVNLAGDVYASSSYNTGSADFGEYFESVHKEKIPVGTSVVMETDGSGFIRIARKGEIPFGVISDTCGFLGNNAEEHWHGKFSRDEEGKIKIKTHEMTSASGRVNKYEAAATSPEFDPKRKYIPRSKRPEWNIVGFIGQCKVLPGQPVDPRWIYMKNVEKNGKTYHLYLIR